MNYYNEFDSGASAWLRELIRQGLLPPGDVDERSIEDVRPSDLRGYTQCHWFAGIGGWSLALDLAGWPRDRPVWTGSCPCQPFSSAGQGAGFDDQRHLWPAWYHLIRECRPAAIFGEQVASPDALRWWDLVSADLEATGYASGAADLCAAGVGAPHIRQRLYWVANANDARLEGRRAVRQRADQRATGSDGVACGLADANGVHASAERQQRGGEYGQQQADGGSVRGSGCGPQAEVAGSMGRPSSTHGGWSDPDWLRCRDGKWRPVESGTFPLFDGVPGRVVKLRAYGNAIVPALAAEFIRACTPA